jgi:hypothetical protein
VGQEILTGEEQLKRLSQVSPTIVAGDNYTGPPPVAVPPAVAVPLAEVDTEARAREEAEAIVQNALRAKLGRDPRDAEYKQLLQTLTSAEKANPSITTQTQTAPGQYSTTTTGGLSMVGKGQVVEQAIMENPELETEAVNKTLNSYGDVIAKIAGVR